MPGKDLVTESCVRKLAPGSVLRLTPERIATPAALDLAFQLLKETDQPAQEKK